MILSQIYAAPVSKVRSHVEKKGNPGVCTCICIRERTGQGQVRIEFYRMYVCNVCTFLLSNGGEWKNGNGCPVYHDTSDRRMLWDEK